MNTALIVMVLFSEAVLNQRTTQRTVLSLAEQKLSPPMIEQSDDAATILWGDVGGAKGMRVFDHKAGLAHTSPSGCIRCPGFSWPGWGLTTTTPQDQVTLLRQLVRPSRVLDKNAQKYALYLLEHVTPSQRRGVSAGVPAGVTLALKNIPDADDPAGIVGKIVGALPSGSWLAIAHPASDISTNQVATMTDRFNRQVSTGATLRTRAEISAFFTGTELLPPGVVQYHQWQPGETATQTGSEIAAYCGLGRKP